MARTREFNESDALNALKDVFWRKGFEGASYDDLMTATKLGKGSLYAAFGDKRSVYLRSLNAYISQEVEAAVLLLNGQSVGRQKTGKARINALLTTVIDEVEERGDRKGCFLCNAAVDLAPFDKNVEAVTLHGFDRMRKGFMTALQECAPDVSMNAVPKPSQEIKMRAENLLAVYFGMRVMAKGGASVAQLTLSKKAAIAQL